MSFDVEKVLLDIAKRADARPRKDDYKGEDGLTYCGKCHRQRESLIPLGNGKVLKVPCICQCDEDADRRARERQKRMEMDARVKLLRPIDVLDSTYGRLTFDMFTVTPDNEANLKVCRTYVNTFDEMVAKNWGLLMYGDVGTGKSFAAACIANELKKRGRIVVMTSFVKILEAIQKGELPEHEIVSRLNDAELVIFDDLGAERSTDYALEKVFNIIDSRYRKQKPMILTTNLTFLEMKNETDIRYSRVYDRVFASCQLMEFRGTSWRRKMANRNFREFTEFIDANN